MTSLLRLHWGLLVVLVIGLLLRVALIASYSPAILSNPDTWGYVEGAKEDLFVPSVRRPAGYAVFLRALHEVSSSLEFAIVVQHLLGLLAVVLVYAIVLRAGFARAVALIPAAVAAVTIDLLYLEHAPLSETLFMVLLLGATLLIQVGLESQASMRRCSLALAAAGTLLGAAVTVRTSAVFLVVPVTAFVLLARRASPLRRVANGAAVALSALVIVLAYMVAQQAQTDYFGLNPGSGWMLYARAAPFAECKYFDEPPGTEKLCEATHPSTRPGGDFYAWDASSPGWRLGADPLASDDLLGSWSRAAITQQPKAYLDEVLSDLWRYVDPYPERRVKNGGTPDLLSVDSRSEEYEANNRSVINPYYGGAHPIEMDGMVDTLASWQRVLRFHGPLVLASLILVISGLFFARGTQLRSLVLLALVGYVVPVVTVVTVIWNWRYAVPLQPAMAAAGAVGGAVTVQALRAKAPRPRAAPRA